MTDDANNLSYDEAAKRLGLTVNELRDLRADGRIRDHANYGNWTFAAEDVETLKAELEAEATTNAEQPTDDQPESGQSNEATAGETKSYSPSKYEPGGDASSYSSKYQSTSYDTPQYDTPKYD
ncbi:MAG TPA: hypothetical protein DIC23_13450, partial [Planctomycetaceae bacterium]|nr:hypothetical protein [Planctomycetaceae bacterium]